MEGNTMQSLLYSIVMLISRIHTYFLSWNDSIENSFTAGLTESDKSVNFFC